MGLDFLFEKNIFYNITVIEIFKIKFLKNFGKISLIHVFAKIQEY